MTRRRNDDKGTEFGDWLRAQDEIDSYKGYWASNLDYIWYNKHTKKWILIEEKRYKSGLTGTQKALFKIIKACAKTDPNYCGFYLIQFERTSPEDGRIWINSDLITKVELTQFLIDIVSQEDQSKYRTKIY